MLESESKPTECDNEEIFDLQNFFPYKTRVFYRAITGQVEAVYSQKYGLKPYEWRTLAILGQHKKVTPADIVSLSSIDKVSVSRAVTSLLQRKWIIEKVNKLDSRSKVLRLSKAGSRAYNELLPKMIEVEKEILSPLNDQEIQNLMELMDRVRLGLARHKTFI